MNTTKAFLDTIYHLRTEEQIILYDKLIEIPKQEEADAMLFLETEYEKEALNYPYTAPPFNSKAALWAAKTVYFAAQLFLYREHKLEELKPILPKYEGTIDASAVLSADICLRFLPQIYHEMKLVDADDPVVNIFSDYLHQFHYSMIGTTTNAIDSTIVFTDDCLKQLYLDRIVERKDSRLAAIPRIKTALLHCFGDYQKMYWKEF
ncbi:hypothetical protein [Flavobacterium sp. GCM10027622]|uniref:hypothetical protein n=1 Tax=unclassified Flavobacterium TaxID=196869 RepID=UPI00361AB859